MADTPNTTPGGDSAPAKAVADAPPKKLRSERRKGCLVLPPVLALPSQEKWQAALSLGSRGAAYIVPIKHENKLTVDKKARAYKCQTKGQKGSHPLKDIDLNAIRQESPDKIGMTALRVIYSGIFQTVLERIQAGKRIDAEIMQFDRYKVLMSDLRKALGLPLNCTKEVRKAFTDSVKEYVYLVGVIKAGEGDGAACQKYPAFLWVKDNDDGTMTFMAPYLSVLACTILKHAKVAKPTSKLERYYGSKANHMFLVASAIGRSKDNIAIEIVGRVCCTLVRRGTKDGTQTFSHIAANTIVNDIEIFHAVYQREKKNGSNRMNIILKRHFENAWSLLRSYTLIPLYYKDFVFPDGVPTTGNIDKVFEPSHSGRVSHVSSDERQKFLAAILAGKHGSANEDVSNAAAGEPDGPGDDPGQVIEGNGAAGPPDNSGGQAG